MKILHIVTNLHSGGTEYSLYNLLKGGLAKHFDNYVLSLKDKGIIGEKIESLGVEVIALGVERRFFFFTLPTKLHRIVKTLLPDIIQGWMPHGNLAAVYAWWLQKKRSALVWNIRQSLYKLSYEKYLTRQIIYANKVFSRQPNVVIYNSKVARKHHEQLGFSSVKGQVIPNGIDTNLFYPSENSRIKTRRELKISPDTLVVGHIARFHPMKDHINFLKAALKILADNKKIVFLLAGRGVSFDNTTLVRLIPETQKSYFRLLGEREDIPNLMNAMDIFCLSSYTEAFPNVLGEAMACGVPCVTTDVGDAAEIVDNTGIIVPPRNPLALAEGIKKLIEMGNFKRKVLGHTGRERIIKHFSLKRMVKNYLEVYERVLGD